MKGVKVILNEDVYNLGEEGDVREVAPGYARNYLIPKGMAVPFTRQYMALFEDRRAAIEKSLLHSKARYSVQELIDHLARVSARIESACEAVGGAGQAAMLDGTVRAEDIEAFFDSVDAEPEDN